MKKIVVETFTEDSSILTTLPTSDESRVKAVIMMFIDAAKKDGFVYSDGFTVIIPIGKVTEFAVEVTDV